ncbi:MAG TPA: hypothetical protein PKA42_03000 [Candidatus Paceibacterota bacterium]|nr:hypothetical protein [Candidatus Paceibacterota bacterium]HMO83113.1 hypothetical protein [Candidatus Paceibacterota bacterium]
MLQTSAATAMVIGGDTKPAKLLRAREIMGSRFVPLSYLSAGASFSIPRRLMEEIRGENGEAISEARLHQCQHTHDLFLMPKGSILDWVEYLGRHSKVPILQMNNLDVGHFSLNDKGASGYHLIRRQLYMADCGAPCKKLPLCLDNEELSSHRTRFAYLACLFLSTALRYDFDTFGICHTKPSSTCSIGSRFMVGHFGREGMRIESWRTCHASWRQSISEVPDFGGRNGLATEMKL